jgi:hypothetical protein
VPVCHTLCPRVGDHNVGIHAESHHLLGGCEHYERCDGALPN